MHYCNFHQFLNPTCTVDMLLAAGLPDNAAVAAVVVAAAAVAAALGVASARGSRAGRC